MGGCVLDPPNLFGPIILDNELLVEVRGQSTPCIGGLDQRVDHLVPSSSKLQMSGSDSLHPQILTGISFQLEHLGGQIFQDSIAVHIFVSVALILVSHHSSAVPLVVLSPPVVVVCSCHGE